MEPYFKNPVPKTKFEDSKVPEWTTLDKVTELDAVTFDNDWASKETEYEIKGRDGFVKYQNQTVHGLSGTLSSPEFSFFRLLGCNASAINLSKGDTVLSFETTVQGVKGGERSTLGFNKCTLSGEITGLKDSQVTIKDSDMGSTVITNCTKTSFYIVGCNSSAADLFSNCTACTVTIRDSQLSISTVMSQSSESEVWLLKTTGTVDSISANNTDSTIKLEECTITAGSAAFKNDSATNISSLKTTYTVDKLVEGSDYTCHFEQDTITSSGTTFEITSTKVHLNESTITSSATVIKGSDLEFYNDKTKITAAESVTLTTNLNLFSTKSNYESSDTTFSDSTPNYSFDECSIISSNVGIDSSDMVLVAKNMSLESVETCIDGTGKLTILGGELNSSSSAIKGTYDVVQFEEFSSNASASIFEGATVSNLIIRNGVSEGVNTFSGVSFSHGDFSDCVFTGESSIENVEFLKQSKVNWEGGPFSFVNVSSIEEVLTKYEGGDLFYENCNIVAKYFITEGGEIAFLNTTFNGIDSTFDGDMSIEKCIFSINEGKFTSDVVVTESTLNLSIMEFEGDLSVSSQSNVDFDNVNVEGEMRFTETQGTLKRGTYTGEVALIDCIINMTHLSVDGAFTVSDDSTVDIKSTSFIDDSVFSKSRIACTNSSFLGLFEVTDCTFSISNTVFESSLTVTNSSGDLLDFKVTGEASLNNSIVDMCNTTFSNYVSFDSSEVTAKRFKATSGLDLLDTTFSILSGELKDVVSTSSNFSIDKVKINGEVTVSAGYVTKKFTNIKGDVSLISTTAIFNGVHLAANLLVNSGTVIKFESGSISGNATFDSSTVSMVSVVLSGTLDILGGTTLFEGGSMGTKLSKNGGQVTSLGTSFGEVISKGGSFILNGGNASDVIVDSSGNLNSLGSTVGDVTIIGGGNFSTEGGTVGNVIVTSSTFQSSGSAIGDVTLSSGSFSSGGGSIGDVTVSGGAFKSSGSAIGNINLSNGSFSSDGGSAGTVAVDGSSTGAFNGTTCTVNSPAKNGLPCGAGKSFVVSGGNTYISVGGDLKQWVLGVEHTLAQNVIKKSLTNVHVAAHGGSGLFEGNSSVSVTSNSRTPKEWVPGDFSGATDPTP